jgi:hypothetical protein
LTHEHCQTHLLGGKVADLDVVCLHFGH